MQVRDSRYHKVWKITNEKGMKKIDLGDSKKNQDGTYENWTWFGCLLVGEAKNVELHEKDTITINAAQVQKRKYKDKYYDNVVIFNLEVTESANQDGEENDITEDDVFEPTDNEDMPWED